MSSALDRLKELTSRISSYELARKENLRSLSALFTALNLSEKVGAFDEIFEFKAINLSGISLSEEDIGTIKEGKYLQIIGIKYDREAKVKNRNISLGYYGRVEKVDAELRETIVRFIIAWRFEKSFRTLEHYYTMLEKLPKNEELSHADLP
ncbi:hypothetical protein [Sulfurimonas sp. HSL3-7]|uniref:hypothetical protein n=1 Tax=Sulfonitrofixus jiaomeiensis TaxID=3131938 RepID=UPI0031F9DD00